MSRGSQHAAGEELGSLLHTRLFLFYSLPNQTGHVGPSEFGDKQHDVLNYRTKHGNKIWSPGTKLGNKNVSPGTNLGNKN